MSLRLRKIKECDLENIINWRMMPEVTNYMYTNPILDLEKQKIWFSKIQKSDKDLYWIIEIDNTEIGVLSINNIDRVNKRCTWAYYIGNTSFRGRGIATTLECNIYNYVFDILNFNKLSCEVFEFNDKVIEIHKKFGSEVEGVFKQQIFKNSKFYNIVCMGITKNVWNNIKELYNYEKIYIE